jgi:hypothetical protein
MKIESTMVDSQEYFAETLRKNNKIDEAVNLLRSLKKTIYGHIILAKCYEDMQEYDKAFFLLRDVFEYGGSNIFFLKNFINISMKNSEYIYAEKAIMLLRNISVNYDELNIYLNQIQKYLKKV